MTDFALRMGLWGFFLLIVTETQGAWAQDCGEQYKKCVRSALSLCPPGDFCDAQRCEAQKQRCTAENSASPPAVPAPVASRAQDPDAELLECVENRLGAYELIRYKNLLGESTSRQVAVNLGGKVVALYPSQNGTFPNGTPRTGLQVLSGAKMHFYEGDLCSYGSHGALSQHIIAEAGSSVVLKLDPKEFPAQKPYLVIDCPHGSSTGSLSGYASLEGGIDEEINSLKGFQGTPRNTEKANRRVEDLQRLKRVLNGNSAGGQPLGEARSENPALRLNVQKAVISRFKEDVEECKASAEANKDYGNCRLSASNPYSEVRAARNAAAAACGPVRPTSTGGGSDAVGNAVGGR